MAKFILGFRTCPNIATALHVALQVATLQKELAAVHEAAEAERRSAEAEADSLRVALAQREAEAQRRDAEVVELSEQVSRLGAEASKQASRAAGAEAQAREAKDALAKGLSEMEHELQDARAQATQVSRVLRPSERAAPPGRPCRALGTSPRSLHGPYHHTLVNNCSLWRLCIMLKQRRLQRWLRWLLSVTQSCRVWQPSLLALVPGRLSRCVCVCMQTYLKYVKCGLQLDRP